MLEDCSFKGSKADSCPQGHLCHTKIKSPQWLTHKAANLKSIIDSWRKRVCARVCWKNMRRLFAVESMLDGQQKKEQSLVQWKERLTQGLHKWMGAGGKHMNWRVYIQMQTVCQQDQKASVEELIVVPLNVHGPPSQMHAALHVSFIINKNSSEEQKLILFQCLWKLYDIQSFPIKSNALLCFQSHFSRFNGRTKGCMDFK